MKTRICKDGKVIKIKDKVIFNDKYINFNEYDNDDVGGRGGVDTQRGARLFWCVIGKRDE